MRRLYERMRARKNAESTARVVGTISWSIPVLGVAIGNGLAFALAAYLYRVGSLSIGTAFIVYYYVQLMFEPIRMISDQVDDFQKASAGIVRIQALLATHSVLPDGAGMPLPPGPLSIEFANVRFAYEDGETVAHGLSFCLDPGRVLGLLGRTGSGKTTLTRLLLRLYDPTAGAIRLGGVDLRERRTDPRCARASAW